jgi:hypothetical protein
VGGGRNLQQIELFATVSTWRAEAEHQSYRNDGMDVALLTRLLRSPAARTRPSLLKISDVG